LALSSATAVEISAKKTSASPIRQRSDIQQVQDFHLGHLTWNATSISLSSAFILLLNRVWTPITLVLEAMNEPYRPDSMGLNGRPAWNRPIVLN
jgi:hypothetical protein